ncbi:MAG: D-amino acid dehydrogenase [Alphaproteobacteria bacterium]|nr:D-amino acid dehydrogenase [Alphaproteobacteria bacterium]
MKIIVIGSGLLGVTTAYELGKRGFDVTVLDRGAESASETSHSNGGQLSYSHAEPWANASVLPKLPSWVFRDDAPLVLRPRADWEMTKWGLKFLRNCTSERARINCVNMLRLGLYSRERMMALAKETGIAFDYKETGILHIFDSEKEFDHAKEQNEFQAKFGGQERVLSREETLKMEPALAGTNRYIIGGIHAFLDGCGDARLFCQELAKYARERYGVKFVYGVNFSEFKTENDTISALSTDKGDLIADGYVLAAGSYSSVYLRDIGIDVPIYPMKGYSITIEADAACPNISLTDGTHKIVYSRLGDRLRIAGTAEFAGYNQNINPKRITPIVRAAKELFPHADWAQDISTWACLRPSTPDGPPILGRTPYSNLFLNTGHGTLGWTQAAGSAAIVADIMEGKNPAILMHGLTIDRYIAPPPTSKRT